MYCGDESHLIEGHYQINTTLWWLCVGLDYPSFEVPIIIATEKNCSATSEHPRSVIRHDIAMNAWLHNIIDINVAVSFSAKIITQYCPGNGLDFDNMYSEYLAITLFDKRFKICFLDGVYEYIHLIS